MWGYEIKIPSDLGHKEGYDKALGGGGGWIVGYQWEMVGWGEFHQKTHNRLQERSKSNDFMILEL